MKKYYLIVMIFSAILTSCTDFYNDTSNNEMINLSEKLDTIHSYTIPLQTALSELEDVLQGIDQTSSGNNSSKIKKIKREISTIQVIYRGAFRTSNKNGSQKIASLNDSLLYVVDFADDAGSAVLAADSRITEPVLAITEDGSIINEIPLYEEGTSYGDTCLQNFSLYNQDEDDYYVGKEAPVLLEYCYDYADDCVSGSSTNNTIVKTTTGSWTINEKIYPKLKTAWHQRSPFNDAVPKTRWFFWQSYARGPAGCVPIAIAQIMAYQEFPKNLTCNGYSINWSGIKNICTISNKTASGSNYDRLAVAQLVSNIGSWCNAVYTPDWAFALPRKARDCMSTLGYQNVVRDYGYSETKVINMLQNDNPVFIAAISGIVGGHAWVIDGYINRSREIKGYNSAGTLVKTSTETQSLMHCNFGWQGSCNGYYTSGIFNTKAGAVEHETYDSYATSNDNFNWAFHIITYNHPN